MIPTTILTDDTYQAVVRCPCRSELTFRLLDGQLLLDLGSRAGHTADSFVWAHLKAGAGECGCMRRVQQWRFAPAIPEAVVASATELDRRRSFWRRLRQNRLADWGAATDSAAAVGSRDPDPLTALAWSLLGVRTAADVDAFCDAGVLDGVDALEWARAGVTCPSQVEAWLRAGAIDGHDAACRARAGETPDRTDTSKNGCHALHDGWPGCKPASTECARRTGALAGPTFTRLTVALPTGGTLELSDGVRRDQPIVTGTTRDATGTEARTLRIHIPDHRREFARSA